MHRHILIAMLCLFLGACGSRHLGKPDSAAPEPDFSSYQITRDLRFTPDHWPEPLLLDVYRPDGAGPFPSVLLIHGGAWKRGDRDQVTHLAERLVERGYLVVNTTYRLVPRYVWPSQLQDIHQALRWMRQGGLAYGVDPSRIGTFGYSAGGHLSALAGHAANDPIWNDPLIRIKAIVAGGTPADLNLYEGGHLVPAFIGGSRQERLEAFTAASPITYVNAGDPPVFQYHATLDDYVPFDQATRYRAALDAASIPNELFVIRGHGHISAFFFDDDAVSAALVFLDRYLR